MRTFLFLPFLMLLFIFSCKNEAVKTTVIEKKPTTADFKEAAKNVDDYPPRNISVDIRGILPSAKKVKSIGIQVNGIGYPTIFTNQDVLTVNISGVKSGVHNFKILALFEGGGQMNHEFKSEISEATTSIAAQNK